MPFHTRTTTIVATAWCNVIHVYTQSGDGDIREGCHDPDVNSIGRDQNSLLQADGWFHGALHGSCDPGSTLCSISWGSGNLSILYQTHDNVIHEMRHDGRDWYLSGFTQDAIPGTDMGEVHSESGDRVVFFFQDKESFLCYRVLGGFTFPETNLLGSMAMISWPGPQIRVYMQDHNNNLIKWGYSGGWSHGVLTAGVLPNADIAAFWRNSHNGFFIHVYWTSYDKKIWTAAWPGGWMPESQIGYLSSCGTLAGSMSGNYFTDNGSGIDQKIICKVIVRSGSIVDGLQFQFSDGTLTPWRGGQGGVRQEFALQDKEDITQILVCSNGTVIQKLSFITSKGRQSIWFGIDGQHPDVWEFEGKALAGFSGATGQYVNGLQALWSERQSTMPRAIMSSGMKNTQLTREVQGLSQDLSVNLHGPAEAAVTGIIALAHSVKDLSKASGTASDALVAKCKGQSVVVSKRFEDLHTNAHGILEKATKLATDITYQEATTQSRIKCVGEMLQISQAMRVSEEKVRQMRLDRIEDAKAHIQVAEKTRADAQHKTDQAKKARIVRDIFTFGLGEEGLAHAQASVNAINEELNRFTQLKHSLDGFGPVLQSQANSMKEMTTRIQDLENHALDAGVFLLSLAGKASVLAVQHTAKQLAASVLAIESLMGTGTKLTGVLVTNPDSMDAALQAIAKSPVPPSPTCTSKIDN
ncbi:hypothetical protein K438DRAFT_1955410 [Mycena galopus ATCC 62051]|nr:hypothetical protein K438DRAFT_1955410 [Mycena galopus ATCC 62051]